MEWKDFAHEFAADGSPRLILIGRNDREAVREIYGFLRRCGCGLVLNAGSGPAELVEDLVDLTYVREQPWGLDIDLGGVVLRWESAIGNEMKMSFMPQLVSDRYRALVIFKFMAALGRLLGCGVTLVHPGNPDSCLFSYRPGISGVSYKGEPVAPFRATRRDGDGR